MKQVKERSKNFDNTDFYVGRLELREVASCDLYSDFILYTRADEDIFLTSAVFPSSLVEFVGKRVLVRGFWRADEVAEKIFVVNEVEECSEFFDEKKFERYPSWKSENDEEYAIQFPSDLSLFRDPTTLELLREVV